MIDRPSPAPCSSYSRSARPGDAPGLRSVTLELVPVSLLEMSILLFASPITAKAGKKTKNKKTQQNQLSR